MKEEIRIHQTRFGRIEERGSTDLVADHATFFMMEFLDVHAGDRTAEPGCGTGLLSIGAALAGAAHVTGTDIDGEVIAAARQNAVLNNVKEVVSFQSGSLLDSVPGPLDLVVALLPHKPGPRPFNLRYYGGADGTDLLVATIHQSAERLVTGGRLMLYVNSIANSRRVQAEFERQFKVTLRGEKRRYFTPEEFESLTPGLPEYLREMRRRGEAEFHEDHEGMYFFARVYEGWRK